MPLIVVDPDDLQAALAWLVFGAAGAGFAGALLFSLVAEVARVVWRMVRMRSVREPFALRAKRLEDFRVRLLLQVDRICDRNMREAARRVGARSQ